MYRIPVQVLQAIAKVESGFRADATSKNANGTEDIGLMQINSSWLPTLRSYGITREALLEPCMNLKVGAWVLSNNTRSLGWNWDAIGAYNVGCRKLSKEQCNARRTSYAYKVHAALKKLNAAPSAPVSRQYAAVQPQPKGIAVIRLDSSAQPVDTEREAGHES